MQFRRALIFLLFLLPLAAQADITTAPKKKTVTLTPAAKVTPIKVTYNPAKYSSSPVAAKLSTRAVDAMVETTPSLYNPRDAQTSTGVLTSLFGPKASSVRYDTRMIQAAQIAEARARRRSVKRCWRYVKEALVEAKVVNTYPQTALAKQAGDELTKRHGFRRIPVTDPFKAPVGSVLVYGGKGAGHVEIRTRAGFVSDFESPTPSKRPLLGVFIKPT